MKSIKINFIYNSIYQILTMFLPIITMPYISRILGAESIGIYSYTQSVAYYFVMIAMLGISNYGNRTCASCFNDKDKLSNQFWSLYAFQFIMSLISVIMYLIYITIFDIENRLIALIQCLYIISAAFDINWFFFGIEEFKLTTIRSSIIKITTALFTILFVKKQEDLWVYTLIISGGMLISQLSMWPFIKRYVDFKKPNLKDIRKHIKPNLVLFIPVLAVSLYKIMDKIMIGIIGNMLQSGYYSNAEKIVSLPTIIITSLGTVMLPRMSNLAANKEIEKSKKYIENSMLFVLYFSIAFTFGLIGIGPTFVPIFFGSEFVECINLIIYMSPTIIFISWANVIRTQYLIPNNKDREYVYSVVLGAVINIMLNLILIPKLGALGAVIGTLIAEFIVSLSQTIFIKNQLPFKKYITTSMMFIPAGVLMTIIIRIIGNFNINPIILLLMQIIFGGVIYIVISIAIIIKFNENISMMLLNKMTQKKVN